MAPKPPVIWSADAVADLADIWTYLANAAGRHTADGVVQAITDTCQLLEDHPYAGRARDEVRRGVRSVAANPHVVFYRVVGDVAEIVRMLDGRRDIEDIFSGDGD